jgi:hypothetical protein
MTGGLDETRIDQEDFPSARWSRKPSLASMPGPYGRASHPGRSSRHGSRWSLPFGIRLAIPPAGGRRSLIVRAALAVLRHEALHRRPRLDQYAVNAEVLIRQRPLRSRLRQQQPPLHPPVGGPGSSRMSNDPIPHRRSRAQRTSGTEDRTPDAP